jgi:hypothetical protein
MGHPGYVHRKVKRRHYPPPPIAMTVPGLWDCGRMIKPWFDEVGRCNCVLCSLADVIQSASAQSASARLTAHIARARGKGRD